MVASFNHQRIFLENVHLAFDWMLSWPHTEFYSILFPFFFFLDSSHCLKSVNIFKTSHSRFLPLCLMTWVGMSSPPLTQTSEFIFSFSKSLVKNNREQCARSCRVVFNTTFQQPICASSYCKVKSDHTCYSLWHMLQLSHVVPMISLFSLCFLVPSTRLNIYLW